MKSKERRSAMWGRSILILSALMILTAGIAFAGRAKLSKDLERKQPADQVNVIVQFNSIPTARHHQAVLKRGGKLRREMKLMRSGAYSIPAAALADLEANPDVAYVSVDRPLSSTASGAASAQSSTTTPKRYRQQPPGHRASTVQASAWPSSTAALHP